MKRYNILRAAAFFLMTVSFAVPSSYAKSALEIDASVDTALAIFKEEVFGAEEMLNKAKGVLVMPRVFRAGIGLGGEYGTGALRINDQTVDYYNMIGGSFGFQLGGQIRNIYLLFMEDSALRDFQMNEGWQAGVDGTVTLIAIGASGSIDTTKTNQPILAFVLAQKGLMYNLTIDGSKFNRIKPS